jgi:hypothetical protein
MNGEDRPVRQYPLSFEGDNLYNQEYGTITLNLNHMVDWENNTLNIDTANLSTIIHNPDLSNSTLPVVAHGSLYPNLPFDSGKLDLAREEDHIRESIRNSELSSMSKAKDALGAARKRKMRVVEHYLCDSCDKLIEKPEHGFVVQGNVYVADPKVKGGLIGNNFPEPDADGKIELNAVKQSVLCKECFCKALGIKLDTKSAINFSIKNDYNYGNRY